MIYYFLPAILLLGLITSYEDIKYGKIRNKWIICALAYAAIVYIALIAYYSSAGAVNTIYLSELAINLIFTAMVGFGMWYFCLWTAGDGKLFIAFSALLPLSTYSIGYQKYIPSITLIINIFIPALLIVVVLLLFKTKQRHLKKVSIDFLKEFFAPKQLINSFVQLFAVYWIIQVLLNLLGVKNSYFLTAALTMSLLLVIQKKLKNKELYIALFISLARLILDPSIYSLSFLVDMAVLMVTWRFVISFFMGSLSKLGQEIFTKEVSVSMLRPGMLLSDSIQKKESLSKKELSSLKAKNNIKVIKNKKIYYIIQPKSSMDFSGLIDEEAEGLTQKQIDQIRQTNIKKLKISQTIPFAPFIFLGVLLTMIAKGNILILVLALF